MVGYAIIVILAILGLLFCGIFAAAYVSGMARDRNRDRARRELAAILDRDIA